LSSTKPRRSRGERGTARTDYKKMYIELAQKVISSGNKHILLDEEKEGEVVKEVRGINLENKLEYLSEESYESDFIDDRSEFSCDSSSDDDDPPPPEKTGRNARKRRHVVLSDSEEEEEGGGASNVTSDDDPQCVKMTTQTHSDDDEKRTHDDGGESCHDTTTQTRYDDCDGYLGEVLGEGFEWDGDEHDGEHQESGDDSVGWDSTTDWDDRDGEFEAF
jgi:hypothetical protein